MTESISSALKNWIPYKLVEEGEANYCRWLYLGDKKFTDPFFDDTISKCRKLPENSNRTRCVSSMEVLSEWAEQIESVGPTAIIFHISRCGSTLVSQLLGLQSSNIVLSEVPFFDELLRWGRKHNKMQQALSLLKSAIDFYGTKRNKDSNHLFIKADSWHIHFYKQLRELYPNIPFILLYRQPDEVIRSQQKRRGMQSVQGVLEPEIFGFEKDEIIQLGFDEYMAKVIETYLTGFIEILKTDKLAFAVNYNEGILAIVKKIATVTGITISEKEMVAMEQRSTFHAKYPEQIFEEEKPLEPISEFLNTCFSLYNEVEQQRTTALVKK